jgi:uncharacterized protein with GYD domain
MLANWTDQGIKSAKDSPKRLDAAKKALKELGGEFQATYLTIGDYDIVSVFTAPDDTAASKFLLGVAQGGNIRTRTLKAFPEGEYRTIMGSL